MTDKKDGANVTKYDFDLEKMKASVEGRDAEVAVTLKGPMTADEVMEQMDNAYHDYYGAQEG